MVIFILIGAPEEFGSYVCSKYKPMELESVCTDFRGKHLWKVINPNGQDIPFTWSYLIANKGSGVALRNSTTTFVAPRWGVCTIKYRMGPKDYQQTEIANLKLCR